MKDIAPAPPRICWNAIVRDEAVALERLLPSLARWIDAWVVCDTGSTDGTPEKIARFFGGEGIPGQLHRTDFVDFGRSRNEALARARDSSLAFEWLLLCDADMELVVEDAGLARKLKGDAGLVVQVAAALEYRNVRLLRRDVPARYVGATHEYLAVDGEVVLVDGLRFLDHGDGGNRPGKTGRDIALLEKALAEDPGDARSLFYLAQSLRDAGRLDEAVDAYRRRVAAGGFDEETWYALYALGLCHAARGEEGPFLSCLLEAHARRPARAEPLLALARHYRERGLHEAAMLFVEAGDRLPPATTDIHFVDDTGRRGGFDLEASISGWYCAGEARKRRGRAAALDLATRPSITDADRALVRKNAPYWALPAKELFSTFEPAERLPPVHEGWSRFNPSLARDGDGILALVRSSNYRIAEDGAYAIADPRGVVRTENQILRLDARLEASGSRPLEDETALPAFDTLFRGFEDLRPFLLGGRLHALATVRDRTPDALCRIGLLTIEDARVTRVVLLPEVQRGRHEKNWVPLVRGQELLVVYSWDPLRIFRCDVATGRLDEAACSRPARRFDHLRGGTQAVRVPGGFLACTHEVSLDPALGRTYLHRFVLVDDALSLAAASEPFFLADRGIEFAAGLLAGEDRDDLLLSYGVRDANAFVARLSLREVLGSLREPGGA